MALGIIATVQKELQIIVTTHAADITAIKALVAGGTIPTLATTGATTGYANATDVSTFITSEIVIAQERPVVEISTYRRDAALTASGPLSATSVDLTMLFVPGNVIYQQLELSFDDAREVGVQLLFDDGAGSTSSRYLVGTIGSASDGAPKNEFATTDFRLDTTFVSVHLT